MVRFWIFYIGSFLLVLLLFFYFGGKHHSYIRPDTPADSWDEVWKKRWNAGFQLFFKILTIPILIYLFIPMTMDIPDLIQGDLLQKRGRIQLERQNLYPTAVLYQAVPIDGGYYPTFGYFLKKEGVYKLHYLKNSRFAVKIERVE